MQEIHRFTLVCVFLQAPRVVAGWKSLIVFVFWASMYILKNAFGIFWLWELGFRLTRLGSQEISHRFWGNPSPILGNASPILGNPSPILGKSVADFGKCVTDFGKCVTDFGKSVTDFGEIRHRFWGNPSPISGKSVTNFGEIRHRFWGNPSPISGKSVTNFGEMRHRFWGKACAFFGKNRLRFWDKQVRFGLGKNWFGLGEIGSVFGLAWDKAQVSLLWTLSMFGFGFLRF